MKKLKLIISLLLLGLVATCQSQESLFFEQILNDFRHRSAYLKLMVILETQLTEAVIENDDFYDYLVNHKNIPIQRYQAYAKKHLFNMDTIKINKQDFTRFHFTKVEVQDSIQTISTRGKLAFIDYFFDNQKMIKLSVASHKIPSIIAQLFDWRIATTCDDETGILLILILSNRQEAVEQQNWLIEQLKLFKKE